MEIDENRWEHGSEFHWVGAVGPAGEPAGHPWSGRATLLGSGRDALRALIRFGVGTLGWERVLVPSFLCQDVVGAIADEGLAMEAYFDDPREPIHAPCPGKGDAVLVVNTFGLRPRWISPGSYAGAVIEDHTHDPWSEWAQTSRADYCIASLRKTLPVPDGGVVWSPTGLQLPDAPGLAPAHAAASARKLEAMLLKALFLDGHAVDKSAFRALAVAGEAGISTQEVSAMSPVSVAVANCLDVARWRERRLDNLGLLVDRLGDRSEFAVLRPKGQGSCPFSAVLVCADPSVRDHLRRGLIERRVYPAVLWPLEKRALDLPVKSVELSRRVLSLHCDGRYGGTDMVRVARAVVESLS